MITKNEQNSFDQFVSRISSEKLGIIRSDFRDEWVELIKECIDTKVPVDDAINEITSCIGFAFGAQCILSKFVPDPNWKLDCLQTILKRDGQKIPIFTAPDINDAIGNYIKSNYFSNLKYSELPGLRIAVVSSLVEWRFYAFNPEDKSTWIQDFDFTKVKNDKDIQELLEYMLVMFAYDQDVIKERVLCDYQSDDSETESIAILQAETINSSTEPSLEQLKNDVLKMVFDWKPDPSRITDF